MSAYTEGGGSEVHARLNQERKMKLAKIIKLFSFFSLLLLVSQLVLTTLITRDIYNEYKELYHRVTDFGNQTSLDILS